MPSLSRDLRKNLENTVKAARTTAEAGAREALVLRLPVHPQALAVSMPSPRGSIFPRRATDAHGTPPVTPPVSEAVARLLTHEALVNNKIRDHFVLKDRRRLRETYIAPALGDGLIEYTLPDKPNSRLQKYRLPTKGRALLENG